MSDRLEGVQDDAGKPTRETWAMSRETFLQAMVRRRGIGWGLRHEFPIGRSSDRCGSAGGADRPSRIGDRPHSSALPCCRYSSSRALTDPAALPAIATVAALVPAAAIDVRERRLPDTWVLGAAFTLLSTTWLAWMLGQSFDARSMLLGASVMAGPMLLLHLRLAGLDGLR